MNKLLNSGIATLCLAFAATSAVAADWTPPGPIKLMIGFAAGGGADTQARLVAEGLEARHGWKLIPEQVTGKGGLNLAAAVKDAPADGTVIGMVVTEALGYNMMAADIGMTPADFTGLATTAGFQMGVVARTDKGWSSFEDMIAAAKGGQEIRFGVMSPKLADLAYLLGEAQDVDFNIVSFKGGKDVLDGLNAGDLDIGFVAGIQAKGVAAGDLVNLASGLSTPLAQTQDAPTLKHLGVDHNADGYFIFIGPAGMPEEARAALANAIDEVVSDPSTKAGGLIKKTLGSAAVIKGDELTRLLQADYDAAGALIKAAQ